LMTWVSFFGVFFVLFSFYFKDLFHTVPNK
jgi:hypothetical protein